MDWSLAVLISKERMPCQVMWMFKYRFTDKTWVQDNMTKVTPEYFVWLQAFNDKDSNAQSRNTDILSRQYTPVHFDSTMGIITFSIKLYDEGFMSKKLAKMNIGDRVSISSQ
jgi:NAD(P)H-flavin reductase